MSPRISVLVPTFSRAEYLAECLDSLFSQTLPPSQVIVVNDGSTDGTKEVLRPYRDRIDYFETPHGGKSASINRGLQEVRGDYLWIFDDDDVALPDALERLVAPLERDSEFDFSYCTYFFTSTRPENGRLGPVLFSEKKPDLKSRGFLIPLLEANILGGAALFARTSCYREVGAFDTSLVRSQDYEMAIRIARRFKGAAVTGGPAFHYRQHQAERGSLGDRFSSDLKMKKWWEYDQKIFRQLYADLPLADYLPPGKPLEQNRRQALLQRATVMAGKLLSEQALRDLSDIAAMGEGEPFSKDERMIIRALSNPPYYEVGCVYDDVSFVRKFSALAASSGVIKKLKGRDTPEHSCLDLKPTQTMASHLATVAFPELI